MSVARPLARFEDNIDKKNRQMDEDTDKTSEPSIKEKFDLIDKEGKAKHYARALTRNDAEAEEIYQEAALSIWKHILKYGEKSIKTLEGLFFTTIKSRFLNRVKKKKHDIIAASQMSEGEHEQRENNGSFEQALNKHQKGMNAANKEDTDLDLYRTDLAQQLDQINRHLPQKLKLAQEDIRIIKYKLTDQLSDEEIADILGESIIEVQDRLNKAITKLEYRLRVYWKRNVSK